MVLGNEVAINNGEPEPEAEAEEEEEELQDQMDPIRKECEQKPDAVVMFEKLEECNTRVSAKTETEETCAQELYDYIHHVDHCIAHSIFSKLK